MEKDRADARPRAYVITGMHGGYFLTDRNDFDTSLSYVEEYLEKFSQLNYSMEIEAYTLDRFVRGPQLNVERRYANWMRNDYPEVWTSPELAARLRSLVEQGRIDNVSTYTQPILHALDGEAVVRQFGYARRIQRDVLGKELEYYGAQQPCWCGQIPAILNGINMKGCLFETSWGLFGFAPLRNGERFQWRGPAASEIATVSANPGMRDTQLDRDKEQQKDRYLSPWVNPLYLSLNAETINKAREQGLEHPVSPCLSMDFTCAHPKHWFDSTHIVNDDCDITFTTLGPYLEIARDDGVWEDAFAEFEDRVIWGTMGGNLYLESQVTANRTIASQRLSVLHGLDRRDEEDRMWQATMVGHHHDVWFAFFCKFGMWDYDSYYDLMVACRKEVEERADALYPAPETDTFQVTNPTQHARAEWLEVELELSEGTVSDKAAITDSEGNSVPCRLQAVRQHSDGSVARVHGYLLASVDGFNSSIYSVASGAQEETDLPTRVIRNDNVWEISNDALKAVLSEEGIRLYREDTEYVSDLYLHGKIEGWDDRSTITSVEAIQEPSGIVRASAKGAARCIPFELTISIRPWSRRFDIHVSCDYQGDHTEGKNYWEQDGNLKLVAKYPQDISNLLHHPFELRSPSERTHSAVHFVMADGKDGNGCVLILDRPSGVVDGEDYTGITLCHSGWVFMTKSLRPGVKGVDGNRYGDGRVYGLQEYDVSLLPYSPADRSSSVCAYQDQAYPLQMTAVGTGPLPIPRIEVSGHSIVSNLSREEDGIVLRLWNPLKEETVGLKVPGMRLTLVDLEGNELEDLGKDEAGVRIKTMQIKSVLLRDL